MTTEVWKDIPGYEMRYMVSDQGRVFSFYTWKILKPGKSSTGYYTVCLAIGYRRRYSFPLHELVLTTFKGPRPKDKVGRHLDGNKNNNTPDNLEWGTISENGIDRYVHAQAGTKLTYIQVKHIKDCIAAGMGQQDIANLFNITQAQVSNIALGKQHAHV